MVYGRDYGGQELTFEASGALLDASLVMRDRETDSWWSIMSSDAIGGPMEGKDLRELPAGEKTTFGEWVSRHPDTLVLSVEGREHVENNPYDNYFASGETFRDLRVEDDRLPPKTPVYTFRYGGNPFAVPHEAFEGGGLFPLPDGEGKVILLYREPGSSFFASSRAWLLESGNVPGNPAALLERARSGAEGFEPVAGFDTFWYTWVAVNEETKLLR